jgi:hypothetical protein
LKTWEIIMITRSIIYFSIILYLFPINASAQSQPQSLPEVQYHLTAQPWEPLNIPKDHYLDAIEGMVEVAYQHQDETGAIIDPYLNREHQYSTPYYAYAVGTLLEAGRSEHLLDSGVRAMEHSTGDFAGGASEIPDAHGEFFVAALTGALKLYREHVPDDTYDRWRDRLETPLSTVMRNFTGRINNWRTYAMKGEWLRTQAGLVEKQSAVDFIEENWNSYTQRERIALDKWNLYQDWSSDPQSHAVEAVGRGNLSALALSGYDGPSAEEIGDIIRRGGRASLLLQSPTGQAPPNGRTDNHVFNDILYQLIYESLAEDAWALGEVDLAGQYRHAAQMGFQSILRWQRSDDPWAGSFFITKNYFEPGDRVGYQPASQWGNYSGTMMFHLAEAYHARQTDIPEQPSPAEIGGYAVETDSRFSSFAANAGGMQVFVNLRGASVPKYGIYWTPLGAVRFSRVGWDDRLGPSDGKRDPEAGEPLSFSRGSGETADEYRAGSGITFGPTWQEQGQWLRIADLALHYRGTVRVDFVHPLLVKFTVIYSYITGRGGPYFHQEFIVTPDGVLTQLTSPQDEPFAVTVPLLENDGRDLQTGISGSIASTKYPGEPDQQNFISLNSDVEMSADAPSIQSTYGWLKPVRFQTGDDTNTIFVYPRDGDDPPGKKVKKSFILTADGFESVLARVEGTTYVGRTAAGGVAQSLDLDGDANPDVTFSEECGFILQLVDGEVLNAENDRNVTMTLNGQDYQLAPFAPVRLMDNN